MNPTAYLMGGSSLLCSTATQSMVLNQGCFLIPSMPSARQPRRLLRSVCSHTDATEVSIAQHTGQ